MRVRPTASQLDAYLDGELDPAGAARFEAELDLDAGLKARLGDRRGALDLLRQAPRAAPPANFGRLVQQRVRRRMRARGRPSAFALAAELTAVAALVVVLGVAGLALMPAFDAPTSDAPLRAQVDPAILEWLDQYGTVESVGMRPSGVDLVVRVALDKDQESAFLLALPGHSAVRLAAPPGADRYVHLVVSSRPPLAP